MADEHDEEAERSYAVVVNDEEQLSIFEAGREPPPGWRLEGTVGPKHECLEHIDRVWQDMRPRSLREKMREAGLG